MSFKLLLALAALLAFSSALSLSTSHEGQYAWYTFDEGPSGNRCANANSCDGQRTCSPYGWCQGTSRPAKGPNYRYNEAITTNKCPNNSKHRDYKNRDYYCDGKRTCSAYGWCQGTSRP